MSLLQNLFKEKRSVNNATEESYSSLIGADGFSLFKTNKSAALALSAVFAAVELISNSIAQLPIQVKNKIHDKDEILNSHILSFVFTKGHINKFNLLKQMISDMLLYGDGFAYINRSVDGIPTSLRYLPSKTVSIMYNENNDELYFTSTLIPGGKCYNKDIIHIYKNSYDGVKGNGILSYAGRTIDLCNYTENSASQYWEQGMHKFGIIHAKSAMTPAQAKDAKALMQGGVTNDNATLIKFLPFDLDFQPLNQDATDSQMIESRQFNITEIARYFNINPVLLGDLSHSSYNTIESANIEFLSHTLSPIISLIEEELNNKLVSSSEPNIYINLDESYILKSDKSSTATYLKTLVESGVLCINEARNTIGYAPIENGDKHIIAYTNLNNNTIENIGK